MSSRALAAVDALVEEYLVYRGFTETLASLRKEAAGDKLARLNVDAFMDHIRALLALPRIDDLVAFWQYAEGSLFTRLDSTFAVALHRASVSLKRVWIVEAVKRAGIASDATRAALGALFSQYGEAFRQASATDADSPDLDWTPWFSILYCKDPSVDPLFAKYFSPEWADGVLSSLRNLVALVFTQTPVPALLQFDRITLRLEEAYTKIAELERTLELQQSLAASQEASLRQRESLLAALKGQLDRREHPAHSHSHASGEGLDASEFDDSADVTPKPPDDVIAPA